MVYADDKFDSPWRCLCHLSLSLGVLRDWTRHNHYIEFFYLVRSVVPEVLEASLNQLLVCYSLFCGRRLCHGCFLFLLGHSCQEAF